MKELKVWRGLYMPVELSEWNPVKELKDNYFGTKSASHLITWVESGEGIER